MKKLSKLILALFALGFVFTKAQNGKTTNSVIYPDSVKFRILSVNPDSFPNISVFVKAETGRGEPISNLLQKQPILIENGKESPIILSEMVSKTRPINLCVLIDHSESMKDDYSQVPMVNGVAVFNYDSAGNILYPPGYISPLQRAKESIKSFIKSFDLKKDNFSLIGYSRHIDAAVPLTQNTNQLNSYLDAMKLDTGIAFYDAILVGLHELKSAKGIKAVVVLTDGHDNHSKHNWYDVVTEAKLQEVPVYIIGLGNISRNTLQSIADSTGGHFYYTAPSGMDKAYANISKQIQSIYEVVYTSEDFSHEDSLRAIELDLKIDGILIKAETKNVRLSADTLSIIEGQKKQKMYFIYGGVALVVLVIGLILFLISKRKGKNDIFPVIHKLHPNPTTGIIHVDIGNRGGNLQIMDLKWKVVKVIDLSDGQTKYDLSDLPDGNYLALVKIKSQVSNAVKFSIHK